MHEMFNAKKTALILIGYQNDYFSPQGILQSAIEEPARLDRTLENTLFVIEQLASTDILMVTTPIVFTPSYEELKDPVGILKAICDLEAFKAGSVGADTIPELERYGDRLIVVPGKRGLSAFSNTDLDQVLRTREIEDVVICGVVASICIDSTGRGAFERGYRVSFLSDCIAGRTRLEEEFYISQIYTLYGRVLGSREFVSQLKPLV